MKIFVSYSRDDASLVLALADAFKPLGVVVRMDVEDIRAGDGIAARLAAVLLEADFFVPVITEAWHRSRWCAFELELALAKQLARDGNVRVLPCRLDGAELPAVLLGVFCRTIDENDLASTAAAMVADARSHLADVAMPVAEGVPPEIVGRFLRAVQQLDGPPPSPARVAWGSGNSPQQMEFMRARDELRRALAGK